MISSKRLRPGLIAAATAALLVLGCGSDDAGSNNDTPEATATTAAATGTTGAGADPTATTTASTSFEFTDASGATVTLPQEAERIVCLIGTCVDILAELDLMPVAWNQSRVGANEVYFGDDAASVTAISGTFLEPNLEEIAQAEPDLIIGIVETHAGLRDALTPIAPLYLVNPTHYEDTIEQLQDIGRLTGRSDAADAAAQRLRDKIAAYSEASPGDVRAMVMWGTGDLFGIAPEQSLLGSLFREVTAYEWPTPAGVQPVADGRVAYSLEAILENDPEIIFIADLDAAFGGPPFTEQFQDNPIWNNIGAVQNENLHMMDTAIWLNARGTRSLGVVLDQAMPLIYPDAIPEPLLLD